MATMTIAGARPVGEPADLFVIYEDGTPAQMQVVAGTKPALARPGRFVTAEEHAARLQKLHDATAAYVTGLKAADEARHQADYEALVAAGVAHESARRMAGFVDGQR